MISVKNIKSLGIILAILLLVLGIAPFFDGTKITNDVMASSIILILIGIAYPLIVFKPQWNKAVLFFEGIVIGVAGYMLLSMPYNIIFGIIGAIVIIIAVLAYIQKLPNSLLKFFYR